MLWELTETTQADDSCSKMVKGHPC